jgi:hypothetical protein
LTAVEPFGYAAPRLRNVGRLWLSDEDEILLQDVLDLVMAGRTADIACPWCKKGVLQVTKKDKVTRLVCPACRKYVDVGLPEE